MATTNDQSTFGSLDAEGLTHETLADLANADPVKAVKLIVSEGDEDAAPNVSTIVDCAESFGSSYRPSAPFLGHYLLIVDETGGGEGGGEYVERIIGIHTGDKVCTSFIRVTGCYYSHDGTYWDEDVITRVYPREVVVTQFFETP